MEVQARTIEELVSENHSVAEALHFLGIHFHNYSEKTLQEVCQDMGLNVETVVDKITQNVSKPSADINFESVPTHLLIEYLKHNHFIFIKQRLPYIFSLINNFEGSFPEIKNELKLVFPLFVEDFVTHIYEEEDTLFNYILLLNKSLVDSQLLPKVKVAMKRTKLNFIKTITKFMTTT